MVATLSAMPLPCFADIYLRAQIARWRSPAIFGTTPKRAAQIVGSTLLAVPFIRRLKVWTDALASCQTAVLLIDGPRASPFFKTLFSRSWNRNAHFRDGCSIRMDRVATEASSHFSAAILPWCASDCLFMACYVTLSGHVAHAVWTAVLADRQAPFARLRPGIDLRNRRWRNRKRVVD